MSNIYALEPHTNGKVILHTTKGDIEIELWGKEAPRATRNFIQLCLEGYYDNTIFHRIVPDFLVQGGDPSGTGQGGESIYEDGFPDEFHSRLRFNRRGLVGLANTGQDDNGSQFFITLDRADELTKKHTLFGRVAGDTLFNVMKMTELEVDDNERPLYPPKIKRTEVVLNPFDDIIPRISEREKEHAKMLEKKKKEMELEAKKKSKKSGKKQLNLLSFGEEAEDLTPPEQVTKEKKMKSRYDFMENQTPVPEDLLLASKDKEEAKKEPKERREQQKQQEEEEKAAQKKKNDVEMIKEKLKKKKLEQQQKQEEESAQAKKKETKLDAIEKLKQDIRNISKNTEAEEEEAEALKKKSEKKVSLVELEREKYANQTKKKKKSRSDKVDDTDIFNKLMSFQKKLSSAAPEAVDSTKKEKPPCKLHDIPGCESCHDTTLNGGEDEEMEDDKGWISHKLVFDKDLKGKDLMQRKETVDDYVVIDPRDREAKLKQEEYEKKKTQKSKVGPAFRQHKRERGDEDAEEHGGSRKYSRDDHHHDRKYSRDDRRSDRHSRDNDDRRRDRYSRDDDRSSSSRRR